MKIKVIVAAALLAAGVSGAMAAINTLIGTTFDVTYDTAVQGLYGTPSIVSGNSIHWSPSASFAADSNGTDSFGALTQVVITAHSGFNLASFGYAEDGSYTLAGDVSNMYVNVSGIVDIAPLVAPSLTAVHRSFSTDVMSLGSGVWTANIGAPITLTPGATKVSFDVNNVLQAVSGNPPTDSAFLSKSNVQLVVGVVAVPEPETYAMMFAGLCAVGLMSRRRGHSRSLSI